MGYHGEDAAAAAAADDDDDDDDEDDDDDDDDDERAGDDFLVCISITQCLTVAVIQLAIYTDTATGNNEVCKLQYTEKWMWIMNFANDVGF